MPDRAVLAAILIAALAVPVTLVASGETVPSGAKPYGAYLASTARDGLPAQSPVPVADPGQLPPAPPAWPAELTIGHFDSPGAAQATAGRGMRVRYQYLAGGVNTGNGWATWNPGGSFVSNYAAESVDAGVVPVFSYYMVRQSLPGANQGEAEGVRANLGTEATTRALFDDLELLFRRAHGSGAPLSVLHFEPDLWGFIQQESRDDNAATFPVPVASSGHPDLARPARYGGRSRAGGHPPPRPVRARDARRLPPQHVGHRHRTPARRPATRRTRPSGRIVRRLLHLARRAL